MSDRITIEPTATNQLADCNICHAINYSSKHSSSRRDVIYHLLYPGRIISICHECLTELGDVITAFTTGSA